MGNRYVNTVLQMFGGALSFGIFLYLRAVMPPDEFYSVAVLFFAGSLATSIVNLNLDRKYYSLIKTLGLSPTFWATFFFFKWLIISLIVLATAIMMGVPFQYAGVVYFFGQTMTELYPRGYFEDENAGPQSILILVERVLLVAAVAVGYQYYFASLLLVRGLFVTLMWVHVFTLRHDGAEKLWNRASVGELVWNIRTYFPASLANIAILQVPIWLGGLAANPKAISDLAALRQSTLIPRQLSTIVTRLFHNWMQASLKQFLGSAMLVSTVSVALSVTLFLGIAYFFGPDKALTGTLLVLHAAWSFQIVLVTFVAKRMALNLIDRYTLLGALSGLFLSVVAFWSMKSQGIDPVVSYVSAVALPHLLGVSIAWGLGSRTK